MAAANGLVCGAMRYRLKGQSEIIDCRAGVQISPQAHDVNWIELIGQEANCAINRVLVVEKESVYKLLVDSDAPRLLKCAIVTGKGVN